MAGLTSPHCQMGSHARQIHLEGHVTDEQLITLLQRPPKLESLSFKDALFINNPGLICIAYLCPQLRQLMVYECPSLCDPMVHRLGQNLVNLFVLHLQHYHHLSSAIFAMIAETCPGLTSLAVNFGEMNEFNRLSVSEDHNDISQFFAHQACTHLSRFTELTSLTLGGSPLALSQHIMKLPCYHHHPQLFPRPPSPPGQQQQVNWPTEHV